MKDIYYNGQEIWITSHAIIRARQRHIAYPDQVYHAILTGKVVHFAKHGIKFIKPTKHGIIICIGEDLGDAVVIKTIERGN
ncbi:hypothetical protein HZB02_04990 [Candidatus Woesearchaeota archaeon]|nr:hypothetical protein [Candidatus Woesearchaeota archaeon]